MNFQEWWESFPHDVVDPMPLSKMLDSCWEASRRQAVEICRSDYEGRIRALESMASLWYFVMDERPGEFEYIVHNYTPKDWMDEAVKLRAKYQTPRTFDRPWYTKTRRQEP